MIFINGAPHAALEILLRRGKSRGSNKSVKVAACHLNSFCVVRENKSLPFMLFVTRLNHKFIHLNWLFFVFMLVASHSAFLSHRSLTLGVGSKKKCRKVRFVFPFCLKPINQSNESTMRNFTARRQKKR